MSEAWVYVMQCSMLLAMNLKCQSLSGGKVLFLFSVISKEQFTLLTRKKVD